MLIAAGLGTLGFNLIFKVNPKHIPAATFGGVLSCGIYIFFDSVGANLFVSNFIAMLVAATVCEIFARIFKAPTAIFLLPCAIPLVPGGSLYYTMSNLIFENYEAVSIYGKSTLMTGLGIAAGMITASVICGTVNHLISNKK
jgi:uncharacterized membrane protein YjjB (DUF3815 family)